MIPVSDKALIEYDLQNENDISYKELVQDEIIFIRKNSNRIIKTAKLLYSKKVSGSTGNPVIDRILDFKSLEKYCDNWKQTHQSRNDMKPAKNCKHCATGAT